MSVTQLARVTSRDQVLAARMLRLANELQQGIEPYAATHGDSYRVRSLDTLDPAEHLDELLKNHDEEVFHSVR